MKLSTQPYKGARDFYPEDMRRQKWMFNKLREVVEHFGYEEYNAPLLEPLEMYAAKTGDEIVSEQTYQFEDRGGRKVVIRPEMTPSVSRMVAARRQELAYPMRMYNIGNRWRYERPQRGRNREFWQLDVDIFGVNSTQAETEVIQLADSILQSFGADRSTYIIKLNSRKLVDFIMADYLGLKPENAQALMKLLDRMHKLEEEHFEAQLKEIVPSKDKQKDIHELLKVESFETLPKELAKQTSVAQLVKLIATLKTLGITNIRFDLGLMRGFDYYTDIVFEVFDTDKANNRSMFGGGRYSGLVGLFGVESLEAVGFALGDVTLANFLETHQLLSELPSETDVYAIVAGDVHDQAQKIVSDLRGMGLNVAFDMTDRKMDKQIKTAVKKNIRYALFIGEQELKLGQYKLKDLPTGREVTTSLEEITTIVRNNQRI
jgi:histidyl-tRNA synthetase